MMAHQRRRLEESEDETAKDGPGLETDTSELPDDMMAMIFGHLDLKTQLMVIPSVCKSWARIHRDQMPPVQLDFSGPAQPTWCC